LLNSSDTDVPAALGTCTKMKRWEWLTITRDSERIHS
jgi:hypothetical protein